VEGKPVPDSGGLLERDDAIASVERVLEELSAGRSSSLYIIGEPGLGKTSLLDRAAALAAGRGLATGHGRGRPMETTLPFGLMTQALDSLGAADLLGEEGAAAASTGARAARFYGVLRWLEERAGGGVLLAFDDMHWADADSLALISFIARRTDSLALGLVGCMRPWPQDATQAVADLAHEGRGLVRQLAPLSADASAELLESRVGRPLPGEMLRRAHELCAGNPLLLRQLAVAIGNGEDLPSAAEPARAAFGQGVLLARFAGLPPTGMRYAQAASILGISFQPDIAAHVAGLEGGDVDVALEALSRSGLIGHRSGARADFIHPLFRQALYEDLAGPVRTRLHSRAFAILQARGMDAQAAEHAVLAGMVGDPAAIGVLERAARTARRTGALAAAVTRFEEAVAMAGEPAEPALLLGRAEALLAAGRAQRAIEAYRALLGRSELAPADRVVSLWMLGRALVMAGDHDAAASTFSAAADLAEDDNPAMAAEVLHDAVFCSMRVSGPVLAVNFAARARELAGRLGGALAVRAAADWGQIALMTGDPDGMAAAEPAAPWRMAGASPWWAEPAKAGGGWGPINSFGYCARLVERFDDADRAFAVVREAADRVGAPEAIATLAVAHCYTLVRMGRLADALAAINVALPLAELVPQTEAYAAVAMAHISLYAGRLEESARWCERVAAIAAPRGERLAMMFLWDVLGHRNLREGGIAAACELYARLEAEVTAMGIGEPCLPAWARHAVAAYMASGRSADARRVVSWLDTAAARLPCTFPRIAAATGHAQLAEQAGDQDAAEEHYRAALTLHEQAQMPVEHAETLLDYGAFLRRSGRRALARTMLGRSAELAEGAGAGWIAALATAEFKLAGGRRRTRDPRALSAREQRVAELAAAGLANAEIARQLYVSVSTVETHLEHIYAKLGIHSRYELIAMAAELRQRASAEDEAAGG
jgi:DNA-binding CsgD family transcriptional regulator